MDRFRLFDAAARFLHRDLHRASREGSTAARWGAGDERGARESFLAGAEGARRIRDAELVACMTALGLSLGHGITWAAVLIVDTEQDVVNGGDGVLSLREAIDQSLFGDEIEFAPTLDGQTIRLNGSQLLISRNPTIRGPERID